MKLHTSLVGLAVVGGLFFRMSAGETSFTAGVGFSSQGQVVQDCRSAVEQAVAGLKGCRPAFVACYYSHVRGKDQINQWVPEPVDEQAWQGASTGLTEKVPMACFWNKGDYLGSCSEGYLMPNGKGAWALALAGAMEVRPLLVDLKVASVHPQTKQPDYFQLGREMAKKLPARPGRTNLLWLGGNLHSYVNPGFAAGLAEEYGTRFPIYGGASSVNSPVVWEGKVHQSVVVMVMLSGDFKVTMAGTRANLAFIPKAEANTDQEKEVYQRLVSVSRCRGEAKFLFVNFCASRLWNPASQHKLVKDFWPGLPFFGFYSGGETGKFADDLPVSGGAGCLVACLITE